MASPSSNRPFRFLDLPIELRKHIYKLVFFGGEKDRAIQPAFEIERPCMLRSQLRKRRSKGQHLLHLDRSILMIGRSL